jgi:hypothetical protein
MPGRVHRHGAPAAGRAPPQVPRRHATAGTVRLAPPGLASRIPVRPTCAVPTGSRRRQTAPGQRWRSSMPTTTRTPKPTWPPAGPSTGCPRARPRRGASRRWHKTGARTTRRRIRSGARRSHWTWTWSQRPARTATFCWSRLTTTPCPTSGRRWTRRSRWAPGTSRTAMPGRRSPGKRPMTATATTPASRSRPAPATPVTVPLTRRPRRMSPRSAAPRSLRIPARRGAGTRPRGRTQARARGPGAVGSAGLRRLAPRA